MFISKARHQSELHLLELTYMQKEAMYQNQLRQLEDHMADLRKLVFSPASSQPTPEMREVDQVLTPTNDAPLLDSSQEQEALLRERDRLFSGDYDQELG